MELKITKEFWCSCGMDTYPHKRIKRKDLHKKGSIKSYLYTVLHWCCDDMKSAFDDDFICFGEYDSNGLNKDIDVNITKCSPYPEGASWQEVSITFCPFCGKKIKIIDDDK